MADIRHRIQIAATQEDVYRLTATAEGFRAWWAADTIRTEDAIELGFFKRATVYRLKPVETNVPLKAEWICETGDEWGGTHLMFDVKAQGSGSVLQFAHAGWRAETDYFVSCNTTWGELMFRLKASAEGKSHGPLFLADGMGY
jgi:hypothetical protein